MRLSLSLNCLCVLGLLVVTMGCGGSTDPAPTGLGSFVLEMPDSVDAGEAFTLKVTAVKADGTRPYTEYSGPVSLSASIGQVVPASIQVDQGVGDAEVRATATGGPVRIRARVSGAEGNRTITVRALSRLPGEAEDDASTQIPRLSYIPRDSDFSTDHPDFPAMRVSFNTLSLVFEPGTTVGEANELLESINALELVGGFTGAGGEAAGYVIVRIGSSDHSGMESALAALRSSQRVRAVFQDIEVTPLVVPRADNNPYWRYNLPITLSSVPWGMQRTRFPQAWNLRDGARKSGNTVAVGVLDGGFCSPPDGELDFTQDLTSVPTTSGDHGNHVSGTMAALWNGRGVDGAVPDADLIVIGVSTLVGLMDGVPAIVQARPDVKVINISMGLGFGTTFGINPNTSAAAQLVANMSGSSFHQMLMTLQVTHDVPLIVAATGNDSNDFGGTVIETQWTSPMTNAAIMHGNPFILGAEAIFNFPDFPGGGARAVFSNTGGDVSAPGVGIVSTVCGGYSLFNGTSMAAPHVAGLAGYLWYLNPSLTVLGVKNLITGSSVPVPTAMSGTAAANRIDAWNAVMELNQLMGGATLLRSLCDIDDGTPDGNQRVEFDNPNVNFNEDDADGDGGWGDGEVDMSDFRKLRDHLLQVEDDQALDLDGTDQHYKRDLNYDRLIEDPPMENVYPRTDFNGDGIVDRDSSVAVAGVFNGDQKTDLEVFKTVFDDPHYNPDDLDSLLDSADITVIGTNCLSIVNIAKMKSWVTDSDGNMLDEREHNAGDEAVHVYTLPSSDIYTVYAQALDADGNVVDEKDSTFTVGLGTDDYWEPSCETILLEAQMPQQLEQGTPSPVLVRAGYEDGAGNRRYAAGIDISFVVSGGSVNPASGTTVADGFLVGTEVTLGSSSDLLTLFVTATAPSGAEKTIILTAVRHVACEVIGDFTTRPGGDNTIRAGFGEVRLSNEGSARAEWLDRFKVIPSDSTLDGQDGRIHFKVRVITKTSGYSGVNPSVRSAFWPRDRPGGREFIIFQWTTPASGDPIDIDEEREVALWIRFNRESRIEMRTQAFANEQQDGINIVASHEVLEITKITDAAGNTVTPLAVCTASGETYNY